MTGTVILSKKTPPFGGVSVSPLGKGEDFWFAARRGLLSSRELRVTTQNKSKDEGYYKTTKVRTFEKMCSG